MHSLGLCLLPNTTTGATTDVGPQIGVAPFTAADLVVSLTAVTGAGSLRVFVQKGLLLVSASDLAGGILDRGNTVIWDDYYASTSLTAVGSDIASVVAFGSSNVHAPKDATLTAASIQSGAPGSIWRVKYVVTGFTSASFSVSVQFYR